MSTGFLGGLTQGLAGGLQQQQILNQRRKEFLAEEERRKKLLDIELKKAKEQQKKEEQKQKFMEQLQQGLQGLGQQQGQRAPQTQPQISGPALAQPSQANSQQLMDLAGMALQADQPNIANTILSRAIPTQAEARKQRDVLKQQAEQDRSKSLLNQFFAEQATEGGTPQERSRAAQAGLLARIGRVDEAIEMGITGAHSAKTLTEALIREFPGNPVKVAQKLIEFEKNPTAVSLRAQANNPSLPKSVRDSKRQQADAVMQDKLLSRAKNGTVVLGPDGALIATGNFNPSDIGQAKSIATNSKIVSEAKSSVANIGPRVAKVDRVINLIGESPQAFTLGGNLQALGQSLMSQLSSIADPNATGVTQRMRELMQGGLTTQSARAKFFEEAVVYATIIGLQEGDKRISDSDYRAARRGVKRFGAINTPEAFQAVLLEIRKDMEISHDNYLTQIKNLDTTGYETFKSFVFPPLPQTATLGNAAGGTSPPGSGPPLPGAPAAKDIGEMTEQEIDAEIRKLLGGN